MHRAKHRAAGRANADVLATTLIERYAVAPSATRHATAPVAPCGAVALAERPDGPVELPDDRDLGETGLYGPELFGAALFGSATPTGSFLAVPDDAPSRDAAPLFRDARRRPVAVRCGPARRPPSRPRRPAGRQAAHAAGRRRADGDRARRRRGRHRGREPARRGRGDR